MSLRSNGDIKNRFRKAKLQSAATRLQAATLAAMEPLERRQLLNAVVAPVDPNLGPQSAPLAPKPGHTFYVNGQGGSQWNQASAITPYTTNDLVLNVSPFDTNYNACCEGGSGSAGINLLTNGIIQNQTKAAPNSSSPAVGTGNYSDPSSSASVLSDLSGPWYSAYHLGTAGGATASSTGYDINEIDIISGHQDYRTQMTDDILVQYANSTDWVSLSNGGNFTFARDSGGNGLGKGSAQMAIVSGHPGSPIAQNVVNVKFLAASDITWFRELVVTGTPSGALLGPAAQPHVNSATFNSTTQFVDLSFTNNGTNASNNPFYYQIQRSNFANGPWTVIGAAPQADPGATLTFSDQSVQPSQTYYYRIAAFMPANGGTFTPSDNVVGPVVTPALAVEAHYYNMGFWEGPVTVSTGALNINFNWGTGSPVPGVIRGNSNSSVFTGKVFAPQDGIYTFVGNSDDDHYLYVDGVLVSEDPGGHGQRDAAGNTDVNGNPIGSVFPISLQGGHSYDYVFLQNQGGGGAGAHLEWVTPSMNPTNTSGISPVAVPFQTVDPRSGTTTQILTPTSDAPAAPTGLTILPTPSTEVGNAVEFSFTANNNAVVNYILQRSSDGGATWTTANTIEPASNPRLADPFNNNTLDIPGTATTVKIQDTAPLQGVSYMYRVAGINYDGVVSNPSAPVSLSQTPDLPNPSAAAATSQTADAAGLTPGTYFVQYTWTNNAGQETTASAEQPVTIPAGGNADVLVTIPGGAGVTGGNVYFSNAAGQELFAGSVTGNGGTVTVNALPAPSAAPAPTSSGVGLPAGSYYVEYSWLGNNGTGETTASGENLIVLTGNTDLNITIPAAPAGATSANVYVGGSKGSEIFQGTVAGAHTLTLNRLLTNTAAAPTWNSTFNPSATVTSGVIPNNSLGAIDSRGVAANTANTTANPAGAEAHMFNQALVRIDTNGQNNDRYFFALNGTPTEYKTISQNAFAGQDSVGQTWLYGGGIDFNFSAQQTNPQGINGSTNSEDPSPYPDIPRIHNEDVSTIYTGQIVPGLSGLYTVISNSDDDGFLWIDGKLVSADPGGHGQQDASPTRGGDVLTPVSLTAGTHYNFVFEYENRGGGAGAHIKWIEPFNQGGVPFSNNSHVVAANNCTNQNGATVTLSANDAKSNGYYDGYTIYLTGGKGAGQKAVIEQYTSSNNQAVVNVTAGGNSLLWGNVPDTTTTYAIAWEQGIPLYNTGTNPQDHTGGLMQYMEVPHNEFYNPSTGAVLSTSINFNDPTTSAAGNTAVTNISRTNGVTLTWTDQGASELWFEVQRSSDGGTTWSTIGKTPMIIGTSFTDQTAGNALGGGATYSYRVRGVNYDGAGPWGNVATTNNLPVPNAPTINSVVQGDAGTIGLTFGGQVPLGGGIELQQAVVPTGTDAPVWTDVTRNPLPANTFDYLVTGLDPTKTYEFRVKSVNNANVPASAFSGATTASPVQAPPEAIGTPGTLPGGYLKMIDNSGQFTGAGDLKLNGTATLTGSGYPYAPQPTTPLAFSTASDVANPTAPLTTSLTASPGAPTGSLTVGFRQESQHGLFPGVYYLKYTWTGGPGGTGETTGSAEQIVNTQSQFGGQIGDLLVTVPAGPASANSANIYIGSSTGQEHLVGTVAKGGTFTINYDGNGGAGNYTASSTAKTVPTTDTTGLGAGTYYVEYTWTGGVQGETNASPEQTVTIAPGSVADINVTVPGAPTGAGSANVYIGTSSGGEHLKGSVGGAKSLTIATLPASTAATPPTTNTVGLPAGTYYVEYSWLGNFPSETRESQPGGMESIVTSSLGDIIVTLPASPGGASSANVFIGTSPTTLGLVGNANGGSTLTIRGLTNGNAPNPLNPTAALVTSTAADTGGNGLAAGTYYLKYTLTGNGFETVASAEQPVVVPAAGQDILATIPSGLLGASGGNVYIANTSGQEVLVGSASAGNAVTISSLPDVLTGMIAPLYTTSQRYHTPANALQIAPNVNGTAATAFQAGQDVGNGFNTSFDFQFTGINQADGIAFVIQPDGQGAVGGGGGADGYEGLGHSIAVEFNMYNRSSTGLAINGSGPSSESDLTPSGIDFHRNRQDIYNANLKYDASAHTLTETVTDMTKKALGINAVFSKVYSNINLKQIIGMNNAYVGFSGANGGAHGEKDILNWSFSAGTSILSHTITLPNGTNSVSLTSDGAGNIDWTLNGQNFYMPLADALGLTVVGNGAADTVTFAGDSTTPNKLILGNNVGGTFTLNGLSANPFSGKTLDLGKNKVYIGYSGASPLAAIQGYLQHGYNNNAWNGGPGSILSSFAAANNKYAIGYADSADGTGINTHANTIELMTTLAGDANLDGSVNGADLSRLLGHYNQSAGQVWDGGDFNYDFAVNGADLSKLLGNYNQNA